MRTECLFFEPLLGLKYNAESLDALTLHMSHRLHHVHRMLKVVESAPDIWVRASKVFYTRHYK